MRTARLGLATLIFGGAILAAPSGMGAAVADDTAGSGYAPVVIQPWVNGIREQNLAAMSGQIQAAADLAGVSGQELARVIDHEGGNYLDGSWRRIPTQNFEMDSGLADSVGIGQITVQTAKDVDSAVYGLDDSAQSDGVIRSWLIYDQEYALRTAAGRLRMLQDSGLGEGWPQFMAYALPIDKAIAWKAAGHPMDTATLGALGLDAPVMQARQQYYNEAVNAIG